MATPADIAASIAFLTGAYKSWRPDENALAVWIQMLRGTEPAALQGACEAHVRAGKYAPTIAEILERAGEWREHRTLHFKALPAPGAYDPRSNAFDRWRSGVAGEFDSFPSHEKTEIARALLARGLPLRPTYAQAKADHVHAGVAQDRDQTDREHASAWRSEAHAWWQQNRERWLTKHTTTPTTPPPATPEQIRQRCAEAMEKIAAAPPIGGPDGEPLPHQRPLGGPERLSLAPAVEEIAKSPSKPREPDEDQPW